MQSSDVRFASFVRNRSAWAVAALLLLVPALQAAPKKWKIHGEMDQDFPFQTACIGTKFPAGNIAYKGLTIKLGNDAYMCFDTDLLRMAAGWTGNYLNFDGVTFSGSHGNH